MSQHKKSSNYNAATKARYYASCAVTGLALLDEDKLANSDKEQIEKAQNHLKEAHLILNRVSPNL